MKILNVSNMPVWLWGEGKGIPCIFFPQREFAKRGHEVYFLCPLREGEEKYSFMEGIHIYRFDFPFNFKKNVYMQTNTVLLRIRATLYHNFNWLFFQIFSLFWGIKIGMKIKPQIVCAHSQASVYSGYLISRIISAKFIVRLYGVKQSYWQWGRLLSRIKEFRDYFVFKIPAEYFIILNDGTYGDRLAKKLGVPEKKIKYWREGIEEEMYIPEPSAKKEICNYYDINPSSKIIVSTSRLNYEYGVDRLLKSLVELFNKDKNSICLIAGGGPDREKLEDFVKINSISSRVIFLGIVDRQMIKKLLNAADIFILLSRFHNCTCTMWEAMACGKCIVTIGTDAIKEILTDGENALFISPDTLNDFPKILERLLTDDELRYKLGKNARIKSQEFLEPWPKRMDKEILLFEETAKALSLKKG